ncbi:hypothetical protein H2203_007255 [Taxawa tesnikishii (nom. ined.)]|nr:hypothetical protein H2203_007255 [Dothideales sp. JES 119]
MKNSTAQAFRSVASKIHPQVGLTSRESQRLLNALTASFRQHLDSEHPDVLTHSEKSIATAAGGHAVLQSSTSSADRHLASILTNPLLARPPANKASAIAQLNNGRKHPIKVFEDCVSTGAATTDIAKLCLDSFRKSLTGVSPEEAQKQIQELDGGARVLRWIWANDQEETLRMTGDTVFIDNLTYFLVREKRENVIWELLTAELTGMESANQTLQSIKEAQKWRGVWLRALVKAEWGKSEAMKAFLQAFETVSTAPASSSLRHLPLTPAGAYLTQRLAAVKWNEPVPSAVVSLYDRFTQSVSSWDTAPNVSALYKIAKLQLNHPTNSSARAALSFIRELKQSIDHPFLRPSTPKQKSNVLMFFFNTVQLLHKQGQNGDASWVMEFMREHFSEELLDDQRVPAKPKTIESFSESTSGSASEEPVSLDWRGVPGLG